MVLSELEQDTPAQLSGPVLEPDPNDREPGRDVPDSELTGLVPCTETITGALPFGFERSFSGSSSGDEFATPAFGSQIAATDSRLLVGAPRDATHGERAGAAYVYALPGGELLGQIFHPSETERLQFGRSVAASSDFLFVGSYSPGVADGNDVGTVLVYRADDLSPITQIESPSLSFGSVLDATDDYLLVGDDRDTSIELGGSAHLYELPSLVLRQRWTSPFPTASEQFGVSVALGSASAVVGSRFHVSHGVRNGAAFVFDIRRGELRHSLYHPDPATADESNLGVDQFGYQVAIGGGRVLVGAPTWDAPLPDHTIGSAVLFSESDGSWLHSLHVPNPAGQDTFGLGLALVAGYAVVASSEYSVSEPAGAIYVFDATDGALAQQVRVSALDVAGRLGAGLAASRNRIFAGVRRTEQPNAAAMLCVDR